jgi:RNA polymerase sigma factor (sigma-70 family)
MTDPAGETARLVDLLRRGDSEARSRLVEHACERLRRLASRMLDGYPGVRRWEQTDDVLHNALIRLCRALEATPPESARHFYNLAALQVRRELIDLAHHHQGPQGHGAKHHTDGGGKAPDDQGGALSVRADDAGGPSSLEGWRLFHERVEALPEEEREIFDLLWYEGLSQEEAAAVLGASVRTVKRRWQSARMMLFEAMGGAPPG